MYVHDDHRPHPGVLGLVAFLAPRRLGPSLPSPAPAMARRGRLATARALAATYLQLLCLCRRYAFAAGVDDENGAVVVRRRSLLEPGVRVAAVAEQRGLDHLGGRGDRQEPTHQLARVRERDLRRQAHRDAEHVRARPVGHRQRYSNEEREAILADAESLGVAEAARKHKHGMPQSTVSNWRHRPMAAKGRMSAQEQGPDASSPEPAATTRVAKRHTPSQKPRSWSTRPRTRCWRLEVLRRQPIFDLRLAGAGGEGCAWRRSVADERAESERDRGAA